MKEYSKETKEFIEERNQIIKNSEKELTELCDNVVKQFEKDIDSGKFAREADEEESWMFKLLQRIFGMRF